MAEHDESYKNIFSHARMVEDLLRGFVKEEWVNRLDFSTLQKVNGSYVSDDLRPRDDDVIWRIGWGEEWLYIYILLEFQSSVDTFMAVRIMTYLGLLYQDLINSRQLTKSGKLPPVLPLVLYNGKKRWKAATEISTLIEKVPGGLERYRPQLSYLLLDEGAYTDEELKPLKNLAAALFRLENSREPNNVEQVLTTLIDWLREPEQTGLRRAFTVWMRRVFLPARLPGAEIPEIGDILEVKTMLAERVVEWTKRWEGQGLQKGRKEGIQQGEAKMLTRQLELKFGVLSDSYTKSIASADAETLLKWSEKILTARSLDEIFKE